MNRIYYSPIVLILLSIFIHNPTQATHIRAGEIIAQRISVGTLKYKISVIGYTDTESFVEFGEGELDFGDGTIVKLRDAAVFTQKIDLGDDVAYNVFEFEHTYRGFGRYTIRFREKDRNHHVLNMSNSGITPFYIETQIMIDPILLQNNTPIFTVPPIDRAASGTLYIHNPGVTDSEGDSTAFKLIIPQQGNGVDVNDYVSPDDKQFYTNHSTGNEAGTGEAKFSLNEITGDMVWDAPGSIGEYNVAFMVEEWRKIEGEYRLIGYIIRDMQIIVEESENLRPLLEVPEQICVEAGTLIKELIIGTDPNGHDVLLEVFGGPLNFQQSPAIFKPDPPRYQSNPGILEFEWQTSCDHIRARPYTIQFKVTDQPDTGPKLVDFKSWEITIVAPAPTGLNAELLDKNSIQLDWDAYTCGSADKMQIWRRVDSYDINFNQCNVGMDEGAGYQLIHTLTDIQNDDDANFITSYIDQNNIATGAKYCYRIVAEFPLPRGGESYVSAETCQIVVSDAPVLVKVDVDKTAINDGKVLLKWYQPLEKNRIDYPEPYSYEVSRRKLNGEEESILSNLQDTVYMDDAVNTKADQYFYSIKVSDANGIEFGSTPFASTVNLELISGSSTMDLKWDADVPWSNNIARHPYHYIYRDEIDDLFPEHFHLIDSVDVIASGNSFLDIISHDDQNLHDPREYCYYVKTAGGYGNTKIMEPFLNRSQVVCAYLNDQIPPCVPINFKIAEDFLCENFIKEKPCNFINFSNKVVWEVDHSNQCHDDISSFNIYHSSDGITQFELIANVKERSFVHENLTSLKGCYKVAAVDLSGNESVLSEMICNDNCPNFEMPNVFTPNGDQFNETFGPFTDINEGNGTTNFDSKRCTRFVKSITFNVVNRSGVSVFEYESGDLNLEDPGDMFWNGSTNSGIGLPSGVYYYAVTVYFDVLDPKKYRKQYNGWVHLIK